MGPHVITIQLYLLVFIIALNHVGFMILNVFVMHDATPLLPPLFTAPCLPGEHWSNLIIFYMLQDTKLDDQEKRRTPGKEMRFKRWMMLLPA